MGTSEVAVARRARPRTVVLLAVAVLLVAGIVVAVTTTLAYGATVRGGDQLLPGTTIATVDVGELTADQATAAVTAHLDDRLDATVTVVADDTSWETTARALGATTDVTDVVGTAAASSDEVGFVDLFRLRWLASSIDLGSDVAITLDDAEVAAFVADAADQIDRGPRDAEVTWDDDVVVVTVEGHTGREVERDDAAAALVGAFTEGADEVELPVVVTDPQVPTALAETVAADVGAQVDAALDRVVTVTLEGRSQTVTGREVGAVPTIDGAVAAAVAGDDPSIDLIDLETPDGALIPLLDQLTDGTVVAARDATLDVRGGSFQITPEVVGAAVDRAAAGVEIRAAIDGGTDTVDLDLSPVQPAITAASFNEVLVVDGSSTTLTLYRGGEPSRSWPVAIGTNNSPTPKGTFVVGAKRFEPTWVNPAPDRWGRDMPARIGPGPDNPLGVRALNWNSLAGNDTLIRFHGTPNEASIGSASSNGCVRMFNSDVVELYDLVSSGTTIVSL